MTTLVTHVDFPCPVKSQYHNTINLDSLALFSHLLIWKKGESHFHNPQTWKFLQFFFKLFRLFLRLMQICWEIISWNYGNSACNIEQFFVMSMLISYCWWDVLIFWEFEFLPRIQCCLIWKLVLSNKKTHVFLMFCLIVMHLQKKISHLKNISRQRKSLYFDN